MSVEPPRGSGSQATGRSLEADTIYALYLEENGKIDEMTHTLPADQKDARTELLNLKQQLFETYQSNWVSPSARKNSFGNDIAPIMKEATDIYNDAMGLGDPTAREIQKQFDGVINVRDTLCKTVEKRQKPLSAYRTQAGTLQKTIDELEGRLNEVKDPANRNQIKAQLEAAKQSLSQLNQKIVAATAILEKSQADYQTLLKNPEFKEALDELESLSKKTDPTQEDLERATALKNKLNTLHGCSGLAIGDWVNPQNGWQLLQDAGTPPESFYYNPNLNIIFSANTTETMHNFAEMIKANFPEVKGFFDWSGNSDPYGEMMKDFIQEMQA